MRKERSRAVPLGPGRRQGEDDGNSRDVALTPEVEGTAPGPHADVESGDDETTPDGPSEAESFDEGADAARPAGVERSPDEGEHDVERGT